MPRSRASVHRVSLHPPDHLFEILAAQRDAALDALEALLKTVPQEFAPQETQQAVWRARAVLLENGRGTAKPHPIWIDRESPK